MGYFRSPRLRNVQKVWQYDILNILHDELESALGYFRLDRSLGWRHNDVMFSDNFKFHLSILTTLFLKTTEHILIKIVM